eukprot:gnl/MRDRNA2_/MRDRNA2_238896_c0_seq1.p1 gnl/MRDRNA2_/MRDRNA2_238896_c0~~gnl/MRDRNA2_/MRDRNA2_238896_c0_seq1.p1  ORF type:complete len:153 (+),score=21.64 gnl/MRDRNA2_/MRDRNA2_238896_c0_seq1:122-580(+)
MALLESNGTHTNLSIHNDYSEEILVWFVEDVDGRHFIPAGQTQVLNLPFIVDKVCVRPETHGRFMCAPRAHLEIPTIEATTVYKIGVGAGTHTNGGNPKPEALELLLYQHRVAILGMAQSSNYIGLFGFGSGIIFGLLVLRRKLTCNASTCF